MLGEDHRHIFVQRYEVRYLGLTLSAGPSQVTGAREEENQAQEPGEDLAPARLDCEVRGRHVTH